MDPTEAARVCGQAAKTLVDALGRATDLIARWSLAYALSEVAGRMDPTEAARVCGQAAKTLAEALGRETNPQARSSLAEALSEVAGRMDPTEAAKTLAEALGRETSAGARRSLAAAMSKVAGRMDPAQRAETFVEALERETDPVARSSLASALSTLAGRTAPTAAARIGGQAAKTLAEALGRETDAEARESLATALSAVAGRMDPTEAARVCGGAMRLSVEHVAMAAPRRPWRHLTLVEGPLRYLDPARAKALTRELVMGLVSIWNVNQPDEFVMGAASMRTVDQLSWSGIMDGTSTPEINRRAGLMTIAIAQAASGQFAWASALAAEPFPCRLTTQELVDLLKMPTCFGQARRVVLDHLGNRYGRRFVNHCAFVRFAQDQHLGLDFTTPPERPDPKESLKRMLGILSDPASSR